MADPWTEDDYVREMENARRLIHWLWFLVAVALFILLVDLQIKRQIAKSAMTFVQGVADGQGAERGRADSSASPRAGRGAGNGVGGDATVAAADRDGTGKVPLPPRSRGHGNPLRQESDEG